MLAVDAISFVLFSASVAGAYFFSLGGAIKIIRLFRVYGTTILIPFVVLITLFLFSPSFRLFCSPLYFLLAQRRVELHWKTLLPENGCAFSCQCQLLLFPLAFPDS